MQTDAHSIGSPTRSGAEVTVGGLVRRTLWVWWRNVGRFAGVTLLVQLALVLVVWLFGPPRAPRPAQDLLDHQRELMAYPLSGAWWAFTVLVVLLGTLHMAALTSGAVEQLAGRRPTVGGMLETGLRRTGPVLVAGVLGFLVANVGFALLVLPGIVLALMLSLTVPVVVTESIGPLNALRRSRTLTKGHRWVLLGGYAVTLALVIVPAWALFRFTMDFPLLGVLNPVFTGTFGTVVFVVPAVAYHEIRAASQGGDTTRLGQVFE